VSARIASIEDLREHLQWAIELEHATLPPYLVALYSIDAERNPDAVQVVGSVFAEEMIHLALAANLLNAVGGQPRLDTPAILPGHPRTMPHGDRSLELSLVPFGPEALEMFLRLEQPARRRLRPRARTTRRSASSTRQSRRGCATFVPSSARRRCSAAIRRTRSPRGRSRTAPES
jgi:hypothetical protein